MAQRYVVAWPSLAVVQANGKEKVLAAGAKVPASVPDRTLEHLVLLGAITPDAGPARGRPAEPEESEPEPGDDQPAPAGDTDKSE